VNAGRPRTQIGACAVAECGRPAYSKGFCRRHYGRQHRTGVVDIADATARFEKYVDKSGACWLWTGPLFRSGYGRASCGIKKRRAHRVAFETYIGPIPDGLQVLHRCDVPRCVNPAHLFLGTPADNARDMDAKGRAKWIQQNLREKTA